MSPSRRRIMAVYATHRGIAFAILETPERLIDWGTRRATSKENATVKRVRRLIETYRPAVLVLEDCRGTTCRRGPTARNLIAAIARAVKNSTVRVRFISSTAVRKQFAECGADTKYARAQLLADRFPELASRLPRKRKIYESERDGIAIFEAVALSFGELRMGRTASQAARPG